MCRQWKVENFPARGICPSSDVRPKPVRTGSPGWISLVSAGVSGEALPRIC